MEGTDVVESFKSGIGTSLQDPYSQVHVLLIAWSENDLGEGFDGEIRDLRAIFEKDFNYSTVSFFPLPVDGSQRRRLNTEISNFVENQSRESSSLIIVYYAGHCSADSRGQAEWAAFEKGGPTLPWHVTQQLLFSARGDVLLILDCCNASLITAGSKDDGGRFELIAASAKGGRTPVPGRKSFTRALIRVLPQHAQEGISSESLASQLREDSKITETPVFHDFIRKAPTRIRLKRLQDPKLQVGRYITKPTGHLLFKASLSDDVTGLQIAQWLKTAPPENITAVSIEAIVSRARRMQGALKDGTFPPGSVFEKLPAHARADIVRCMRNLNTVMATTADYARDASTGNSGGGEKDSIQKSLSEIQDVSSTVCAAIETPLLLDTGDGKDSLVMAQEVGTSNDGSFYELMTATGTDMGLNLRQAVLDDNPCDYATEINREQIIFASSARHRENSDSQNPHRRRFKFGIVNGRPVIMEKYKYKEAPDYSGEPYPQTLQQVRKMSGLLRHPKRKTFHVLPCAGFFRDRVRQELGLVFELPLTWNSESSSGFVTLVELYKRHKLVPLGQRIHLASALAAAVEQFHRVGWVHKGIRSDTIAFMEMPEMLPVPEPGSTSNAQVTLLGRFDLGNPYLFGFEYARHGDETTYLDEDHSLANNLYRHPERWGRPTTRFEKSHDAYALGVILLEIALWKDVGAISKPLLDNERVFAADVANGLMERCRKTLPHQVGAVFSHAIFTCLDFAVQTNGMGEYAAQQYFQRNITEPIKNAAGRV